MCHLFRVEQRDAVSDPLAFFSTSSKNQRRATEDILSACDANHTDRVSSWLLVQSANASEQALASLRGVSIDAESVGLLCGCQGFESCELSAQDREVCLRGIRALPIALDHPVLQRLGVSPELQDHEWHAKLGGEMTERVSLCALQEGRIHHHRKTGRNDASSLLRQMRIGALGGVRGIELKIAATSGTFQGGQAEQTFALDIGTEANGASGLDQRLCARSFATAREPMGDPQSRVRRSRIPLRQIEIAAESLTHLRHFLWRQLALPQTDPSHFSPDNGSIY